MKKLITIALSFIMIISLLMSAVGCDRLSDGLTTPQELLDGKTPTALYGESVDNYKNKKDERVPYTVNVEWTFHNNPLRTLTIDLAYGTDSISYKSYDKISQNHTSESVVYMDNVIYIESKYGGHMSYTTDRETADQYINEWTYVKDIIPAMPENIPSSWFDSLKFTPSIDGGYFTVTAQNKTADDHPLYRDFYRAGVDCRLYFTPQGVLQIVELENVTVNNVLCNLKYTISWDFDGNILNPSYTVGYAHLGNFYPDKVGDGSNGGYVPENDPDNPDYVDPNPPKVPEHEHTPGNPVIENEVKASCTESGSYDEVVYCAVEGCKVEFSRVRNSTPPGHSFGEWYDASEPYVSDYCECTYYVNIQRDCQNCGEREYTFRYEFYHKYGDFNLVEGDATIPECQRIPIYEAKCTCTCDNSTSNCGNAVVRNEGVAPGHSFENGACTECGESDGNYHTHTPSEPVMENIINAGCTTGGSYDEVIYCSYPDCNAEISRISVSISPGHSFGEWYDASEPYVSDYCECTYYVDVQRACQNCGEREYTFRNEFYHKYGDFNLVEGDATIPECQRNIKYIAYCTCDCQSCKNITDVKYVGEPNHSYKKGVCIYCNEADPNYTIESTANEYFIFTPLDDGTYMISANPDTTMPEEVILPCSYEGAAITLLGSFDGQSIKSIYLSKNISKIIPCAFGEQHSLEEIIVDEENSALFSESNRVIRRESNTLVLGCEGGFLPRYIVGIEDGAFAGCKSISSINLPSSLTTIGNSAFKNCTGLSEMEIPASVVEIGDDAFLGCEDIIFYCYAESRPEKWSESWCDASALEANTALVVWGYSLESYIPESGESQGLEFVAGNGGGFYVSGIGDCTDTIIVIPEFTPSGQPVQGIAPGAFAGRTSITGVIINRNILYIGAGAFEGCSNITYIYFANKTDWCVNGNQLNRSYLAIVPKAIDCLTKTYCAYDWFTA